jgi:hypothetical protein
MRKYRGLKIVEKKKKHTRSIESNKMYNLKELFMSLLTKTLIYIERAKIYIKKIENRKKANLNYCLGRCYTFVFFFSSSAYY